MIRKEVEDNIEIINSIRSRILSNINPKYNKGVGSFPFDLVSPTAFELGMMYNEINKASKNLSIENLEGELLEMRVYEVTGQTRKPAVPAKGYVTIEGQEGQLIPKGVLVSTDYVEYEVVRESVIMGGKASVLVECLEPGEIGNAKKGEINIFPTTIEGLRTVTNEEDFSNGYNAETDSELRKRYYEFLRLPATSGNKSHYKLWAKDVVGVGDAFVIPLWNGNGTVKVIITDANMGEPDQELINTTQKHIEEQQPIGAKATIVSATIKDITIDVDVKLAPGYDTGFVTNEFKKALEDYRKKMGFYSSYVSLGKIGNILLSNVEGVIDYDNLKLNGSFQNIPLEVEEIPKFTDIRMGVM